MVPSQFYTGLVARLYGPLRSHPNEDPEPYVRLIRDTGEPALELAPSFSLVRPLIFCPTIGQRSQH